MDIEGIDRHGTRLAERAEGLRTAIAAAEEAGVPIAPDNSLGGRHRRWFC